MNIITKILILVIKFYKLFLSPYLHSGCRYLPTCSEYFIECLKKHGLFKGTFFGFSRISRCHPVKFLGGKSGFDPVPKKENKING